VAGGEKTEAPTPKRRAEAREKGQVARSADLNGAVILLAGLLALAVSGPMMASRMGAAMRECLALIATPQAVETPGGMGEALLRAMTHIGVACAPVAVVCAVAAVLVCLGQVGLKPSPKALQPDAKRLNPIQGAKNIFGPNALVEAVKSVAKVGIVGAIVAFALLPQLSELGAMVGVEPIELGMHMADSVQDLFLRAGIAYLVIGAADYVWQRHKTEKSLKMDRHEIQEEQKGQMLPPEVRAAMRRRQMLASRARMMAAVPEADVVVTNPTHFAVALSYDGASAAPKVVAKGQDLIALRIRELAAEHGVPVVPDPPLARALHRSCEVGDMIPEDLYVGVAQVLAWVFRTRGRRPAA
jgi:flagellar biosynthetic protein FlhB